MDYNHPAVIEYIEASKEVVSYFKADTCEPPAVTRRMRQALDGIRKYLDGIGLKMPLSKYPYSIKDKTTWKYITVATTGRKTTGEKFLGDVLNSDFRFGHL